MSTMRKQGVSCEETGCQQLENRSERRRSDFNLEGHRAEGKVQDIISRFFLQEDSLAHIQYCGTWSRCSLLPSQHHIFGRMGFQYSCLPSFQVKKEMKIILGIYSLVTISVLLRSYPCIKRVQLT